MLQLNLQITMADLNIHGQLLLQRNQFLASCEHHQRQSKYLHCPALERQSVLNVLLRPQSWTNLLALHTSALQYAHVAQPRQHLSQQQIVQPLNTCGARYQYQPAFLL